MRLFQKSWWSLVSVGLFAVVAAAGPQARATTYLSSADFNAATTGLTIENYGSYSAGTLITDGSTLGSLSYTFSLSSGTAEGIITDHANSFSGNSLGAVQSDPDAQYFFAGDSFTVTFPTAVKAVGIFANVNAGTTFTLNASTDSLTNMVNTFDTKTFGFFGITSSTPFTSATFTSADDGMSSYNIPQIEFSAAAPEPSTWAMMILGFFGVGFLAYRRKQNSSAFA